MSSYKRQLTVKTSAKLNHQSLQTIKRRVGISLVLLAATTLAACSDKETDSNDIAINDKKLIKISTASGDFHDLISEYVAPELTKEGYEVELLIVTDSVVPNVAVDEGSIDLNLFQHKPYMDEFNRNKGGNLHPLVQVPTAPYGIYPGRLERADQIKDGAVIGIPSNITNYSRGLWILEGLGWISIKEDAPDRFHLSKNDIATNPYNIDIKEIEAAQMLRAVPDLDYAVINGKYALDADLHYTDAIYIEPSRYFVNWIVINKKNVDTPWANKVVEIINSDGFKAYSKEKFKGYDLPLAWTESTEKSPGK